MKPPALRRVDLRTKKQLLEELEYARRALRNSDRLRCEHFVDRERWMRRALAAEAELENK